MLMIRRITTTKTKIMMLMTMIRPCFADLQVLQDGPALRILCLGSPRKPNIYSWIYAIYKEIDYNNTKRMKLESHLPIMMSVCQIAPLR